MNKLKEFEKLYGGETTTEIIEIIHDIGYDTGDYTLATNGNEFLIDIWTLHTINRLNHVFEGSVDVNGIDEWTFVIESGVSMGTDIREWCLGADEGRVGYIEPPETRYVLVPELANTGYTVSDKKYKNMQSKAWFKKLESDYNYDAYFEPTQKIHQHYRVLAEKRGLKFISKVV